MNTFFTRIIDIVFPPSKEMLLVRNFHETDAPRLLHIQNTAGSVALTDFKEELVRALIHEAKFHHSAKAITILGLILAEFVQSRPELEHAIPIPIPLSRARLRERGYNQVTEVIRAAGYQAEERVLIRSKHTKPQTELKREEREQNVADAFGVRDRALVTGRPILLIDDVITTGATMHAAKAALLPHAPASVTCLALAH